MSRKVEDAAGRLKKRRERKGMWDEVNGSANKFDKLKGLVDDVGEKDQDDWEDMEDVDDGADNLPGIADTRLLVVDRTANVPAPTLAEDDEVDKIT
jgi:hypothetical protein